MTRAFQISTKQLFRPGDAVVAPIKEAIQHHVEVFLDEEAIESREIGIGRVSPLLRVDESITELFPRRAERNDIGVKRSVSQGRSPGRLRWEVVWPRIDG
jgi:hypothetical protein